MINLDNEDTKNTREIYAEVNYHTSDSSPHWFSFGSWTVKWWKWCFSIERERNPTIDRTGIRANENQMRPTWFLAGTWVSESRIYPHRKCSIPQGVSILFPVINCEENPLEYPELKREKPDEEKDVMRKRLNEDVKTVQDVVCYVDNQIIPPQVVRSDPEFFEISIRSDMAENRTGGVTTMITEGHWVFLKPLARGYHHINFHGSYLYGKLHAGASYDISVE